MIKVRHYQLQILKSSWFFYCIFFPKPISRIEKDILFSPSLYSMHSKSVFFPPGLRYRCAHVNDRGCKLPPELRPHKRRKLSTTPAFDVSCWSPDDQLPFYGLIEHQINKSKKRGLVDSGIDGCRHRAIKRGSVLRKKIVPRNCQIGRK